MNLRLQAVLEDPSLVSKAWEQETMIEEEEDEEEDEKEDE